MSKEEVLAEYDIDLKQFENDKDGSFVNQALLTRTKRLILKDRLGVVEALRYWLSLRADGLTMTAVDLIGYVNIPELKPDLECLKKEIESGKTFLPDYNYWVDRSLKSIK
jgi:hypothetical protein